MTVRDSISVNSKDTCLHKEKEGDKRKRKDGEDLGQLSGLASYKIISK